MNPITLSSTPSETAESGGTPLRWKNLMFTAARAAVDGIARLTNVIANCNAVSRPRGTFEGATAESATAFANRGVRPMKKANNSSGPLASRIASMIVSSPMSAMLESNAHVATSIKRTSSTRPMLSRRRRCNSGGAAPVAGDHTVTQLVDVDIGGVRCDTQRDRERRRLQERRHGGQSVGSEGLGRDRHRPV